MSLYPSCTHFDVQATKIQVQTNHKAITVTYPNYTLGFRVCYPLMDRLWTHAKRECCDHTNKGHASCQSKKPRVIKICHCNNPTRELTVNIVKYLCYTKGDLVWCYTRLRIKRTRINSTNSETNWMLRDQNYKFSLHKLLHCTKFQKSEI
jgi:hypothetical protein